MCLSTMGCDQRQFITCHKGRLFQISFFIFFLVECHVNYAYNNDVGLRGRNKSVTRHERMGTIGFSRVHNARWAPVKKNTQIHPCRPFRKISRLNSLFFQRKGDSKSMTETRLKRSNCKSQIEIDGLFVT